MSFATSGSDQNMDAVSTVTASQRGLTPAGLLDNGSYIHATCGMHAKLLARLRPLAKDPAALQALCDELATNALSKLQSASSTAIMVAPALGPPTCVVVVGENRGEPDVVFWLMLDPLDIDSKQTTFCAGGNMAHMNLLYKWTGSATPPTHTELPKKIVEE